MDKYNKMSYICPLCAIDPLNHSLVKIKESNNILVFYSCPSQAKLYFDCKGIINHYDGVLSEVPENKKWIWIFDSKGFGFNHFSQINIGINLALLISNKFSHNLLNITIINPTIYTTFTYTALKPFLSEKVNNLISFNSVAEKAEDLVKQMEDENIC
jgi:hypothetical protein